ncbi:type I-E CRISPR-associated protein Cas6/Cse3/CasE [Gilliamella sp. ESL0250]|uniref:type I-E CRISPR-associated protein Cas6/Cse3/CasE n=1 Tax=Gilliamella sp. ESL0250 TaxID=2705036 RepID=UPI001580D679|nr:type I-E CRISPR-associated protein Cas6/Cse3/CasE [Gilliamella sp. ESL0250]NUF49293.1 type I-E CRISPR-associated protein Cas6/Cse3/CasE [Gilliamella sp. ESL0250]
MYFSRVTLKLDRLPYVMQQKMQYAGQYAIHQWLWQLFPHQEKRTFLFREEATRQSRYYYLLSEVAPIKDHQLFIVETKPYAPQLTIGMNLMFSLRANPIIFKNGKRSDVMMNAKFLAKQQGLSSAIEINGLQNQAALNWLVNQGEKRGFSLMQNTGKQPKCNIIGYYQHRFKKKVDAKPITFSSVDFQGVLTVTHPELFLDTLYQGIGKSKGFGCGLFLIKRHQ